ncbi:hypothetical protein JTE90_008432 [Oedothorax gibbosus]|uniref:TIP41-like protein n=1 Tax=Oedothorax gibbosus TaxID=931172 RepID=A0AAV6UST7_9ARAC|nr:hypothetical protein JTE90_008432 [Oedothorax gibbosus]
MAIPGNACQNSFRFESWTVESKKSHILQSRCTEDSCKTINDEKCALENASLCDFCLYETKLELPQLPEMTFAGNILTLNHDSAFGIEFNALDALLMVDSKHDNMKVAIAEAWQESRMENSKIKDVVKPFDWTYTTHYKGTLFGNTEKIKISQTEERIDLEKLKVKSKILFYEDLILFEDELADNGTAQYSVKIRIMPDSFFILLRFFLRVDNLLVKIIDTRYFYEVGKKYILREHMTRESKIKDLNVPLQLLRNPQELWEHLPKVAFEYEKLEIQ